MKSQKLQNPSELRIGPLVWTIVFTTEDALEEDCVGWLDAVNLRILLNKDRPPTALRETLIHEILHAIFFSYGIEVHVKGDSSEREEFVVNALGLPIYQVLLDNREILNWILE